MAEAYAVFVEGLAGTIADIESMDDKIKVAALRAINRTADRTRTRSARMMLEQVAWPASYLNTPGRFQVIERAKRASLSATIRGRRTPTSMARFVKSSGKGKPTRVEVTPGVAKRIGGGNIQSSFLMKLTNGNTGLAVRTTGGKPTGSYKPRQLSENLWLIYGPSVDQVFRSVREDAVPEAEEFLEGEFMRLLSVEID